MPRTLAAELRHDITWHPRVRIQWDNFSCAMKCGAMATIALKGWPDDLNAFLRTFRQNAGTTVDGTDDNELAYALRAEGLRVDMRRSTPRISTLSAALKAGRIPILTVHQPENDVYHAVILLRIDDDGALTFIDPSVKRWLRPWLYGPTPVAPGYFLVSRHPRRRLTSAIRMRRAVRK